MSRPSSCSFTGTDGGRARHVRRAVGDHERNRGESDYVATVPKLVLSILVNKELLEATGHPKRKDSFVRSIPPNVGYLLAVEVVQIYNALDDYGYRIIKK